MNNIAVRVENATNLGRHAGCTRGSFEWFAIRHQEQKQDVSCLDVYPSAEVSLVQSIPRRTRMWANATCRAIACLLVQVNSRGYQEPLSRGLLANRLIC
jgi:hypothetical protein